MLEKKLTQELDKKLDQNLLSFSQELESLVFGPLQKNLSILEKAVEFPFPTEKLKSNGEELISALNGLEELVRTITDDVFLSVESLAITEFLKSYNTELEKIISREEKSIRKVQSEERLLPQTGDIFTVRTGKLFKRLNYRTRKLLNKNFVLHQNIQHWQIIRFIYRNRMQEKLIPILENILPRSCSLHAEIRELLENLENRLIQKLLDLENEGEIQALLRQELKTRTSQISEEIKSIVEDINRQIRELRPDLDAEFERLINVSGTLEFRASRLWPGRINASYGKILTRVQTTNNGWGRNHWILYEDWRFYRKIISLIIDNHEDNKRVAEVYSNRLKVGIQKYFEEQNAIGSDFLKEMDSGGLSRKQLESRYRSLKHKSSGILIRQISFIQRTGLTREVNKIARNLSDRSGQYQDKRTFAKSFQPDKLVRDRDVVEVKPMQLIRVEIAPRLGSKLEGISTEITTQIEKISGIMMQYSGIIDFGISSSFNKNDSDEKDDAQLKQTIRESFSRAADKMKEVNEILDTMDKLVLKAMVEVIKAESRALLELQDAESFLAVALKLARAKTFKSLNHRIRNLENDLRRIGMAPVKGPIILYRKSEEWIKKMRRKIGYNPQPIEISTELSDFLSRTDSVFSNLPYIYQRLYYIEPLEDELLFVGREQVIEQINVSLNNWLENGYSPLVLVGEKGAGATTTFNLFQSRTKDYPFIRILGNQQIYDFDTFILKMCDETGLKQTTDFEELKDHLNNLPSSIIILENLQRYYLRTVNGFSVLKKIFELISSTNQNIQWLTSCTSYAWRYLDRVLTISSYFGFIITLDDINDEGILNVIEQRHKISGFKVRYTANKLQEKNRKIMRLSEEDRQAFLEESYQSSFARFARGNISLGLVHWIRSTSNIIDNTVIISSIYEPESSFFDSLSVDKIITIYMILIHDGLSEKHLSEIQNRSREVVRNILFQLYDDGILVKNNENFLLNPLIYRPAVNFLKLKNYLH